MDSSGFGYRPRRIRLLDQELHLDPDIQRMARELEAQMAARQIVRLWLQPDWSTLLPAWQTIMSQPLQRPAGPMFTPGAGPATPRSGDFSDVTGAVYRLPPVQRLVEQAHDEGLRRLRLLRAEWDRASPGERAIMVTMTSIVVGSSIGIIVANQPTRQAAFDLIKGRNIPIPGVDGLSFQILDRGGSITAPLGVPGLSGSARLQFPGAPSHPDYNVMINLDVLEFLRSR
ncbi:MAG: hypothetical protein NEA02_01100 [Thermoanaerobaculia bacterium]|nr:hypothetical protein [Thermoanaerobaculia bacterium]